MHADNNGRSKWLRLRTTEHPAYDSRSHAIRSTQSWSQTVCDLLRLPDFWWESDKFWPLAPPAHSKTNVRVLDFSSRTKDDDLSLDLDFGTKDHWSGLGLEGHLTDHGLWGPVALALALKMLALNPPLSETPDIWVIIIVTMRACSHRWTVVLFIFYDHQPLSSVEASWAARPECHFEDVT